MKLFRYRIISRIRPNGAEYGFRPEWKFILIPIWSHFEGLHDRTFFDKKSAEDWLKEHIDFSTFKTKVYKFSQ